MIVDLCINCTQRDVSPWNPDTVSFICRDVESAVELRNALVNAGFATEFSGTVQVKAYQGDGTI